MSLISGIYKNIKNGQLYEVITTSRSTKNPKIILVTYGQLYESKLRDSDIILPKYSAWTREFDEFNEKFVKEE